MVKAKKRKMEIKTDISKNVLNKTQMKTNMISNTDKIIIFSLALFLIAIGIYAFFYFSEPTQINNANNIGRSNLSIKFDENQVKDFTECLKRNEITGNIIYIYSNKCIYSQDNTPWVNELKNEGYNIEMLETSDSKMIAVYNCLSGIASFEGTPEYVCIKTNKTHLGAFKLKSEMLAFIKNCK